MTSIRIPAALFLITAALCAGTAVAQPSGPGIITAKDVITLTKVAGQPQKVDVLLDSSHPTPNQQFKVVDGSAEKAAKLSWQVNAVCALRLKSLSVKQADGKLYTPVPPLSPATKSLQKEEVLATFPVQAIRQLCLDIANKTSVSVGQGLIAKHELEIQQNAFGNGGAGVAWVNGKLLLSGQCTSVNGNQIFTTVADKEFPAQIQIRCCELCS